MSFFTATEYTKSQMTGLLHRVRWHKFDTREQAEHWAQRRLSGPLMAPHWIDIRVFRGRRTVIGYYSDGDGRFRRSAR